jgi:hypothetical protein
MTVARRLLTLLDAAGVLWSFPLLVRAIVEHDPVGMAFNGALFGMSWYNGVANLRKYYKDLAFDAWRDDEMRRLYNQIEQMGDK